MFHWLRSRSHHAGGCKHVCGPCRHPAHGRCLLPERDRVGQLGRQRFLTVLRPSGPVQPSDNCRGDCEEAAATCLWSADHGAHIPEHWLHACCHRRDSSTLKGIAAGGWCTSVLLEQHALECFALSPGQAQYPCGAQRLACHVHIFTLETSIIYAKLWVIHACSVNCFAAACTQKMLAVPRQDAH